MFYIDMTKRHALIFAYDMSMAMTWSLHMPWLGSQPDLVFFVVV